MIVISKARRAARLAAAATLAVTMAGFAAGETRGEAFTLDEIARMGGHVAADEFPIVLGGHGTEIHLRFYQKRRFTIGDGSRHLMFLFRATNCWLREGTAAKRGLIDCRGENGPGVFIPVLVVTPETGSRASESGARGRRPSAPDLVLRRRRTSSLADFLPVTLLDRMPYGDSSRVTWIRLKDPRSDSLTLLSAPAAPAALVFCVPVVECMDNDNIRLTNLDDTPPEPAPAPPPAPQPPPSTAGTPPPSTGTSPPAAGTPPPSAGTPPPSTGGAPPPSTGGAPPPAQTAPPAATAGNVPTPPPAAPPPSSLPPGQLHFVIRPAASAMLPGWTPQRMAKRLLILVSSSGGKFMLKTHDGTEIPSSRGPELTRPGDAVVAWSGGRPDGPAELVFEGGEGVELVPPTQSSAPRAVPSDLISPRLQTRDVVLFRDFRIVTPFLYDQWQVRIEIMTKVYGHDRPDTVDDLCRFSLLIPRSGLLSYITWPLSVDLDLENQGGKRFLLSQPVIMPSQLMHAAGEPLRLDIRPTAADQGCITQSKKLASFTSPSGIAAGAWRVSDMPGSPSLGRMDIRPSSLETRGRWLLGLYGPGNIEAGAETGSRAASEAQDRIFSSLTAFLDDFRERNFVRGRSGSQAIGIDLAVIGAADAWATAFSEKSVIVGRFRQPPPAGDPIRLDQEGSRRLSAFLSGPASAAAEVSFQTVGQTIRHYSQLFGELSGRYPPVAVYVGAARATAEACKEWRRMTAEAAQLSGGPRVFGIVFANAGSDRIARQLGQNGRGADEALTPETRGLTCLGDNGPSLLYVSFPDLISRPPDTVLRPAFSVLERWASQGQN